MFPLDPAFFEVKDLEELDFNSLKDLLEDCLLSRSSFLVDDDLGDNLDEDLEDNLDGTDFGSTYSSFGEKDLMLLAFLMGSLADLEWLFDDEDADPVLTLDASFGRLEDLGFSFLSTPLALLSSNVFVKDRFLEF